MFQLLYSDNDKMMPSAFIERIADEQRSIGLRSVAQHNFGTTNHVAHLREKPEDYQNKIEQFLKLVIKSDGVD